MSEPTEVTVVNQVMNVADVKSHVAVIHKVMTEVMKVGTHYDKIKYDFSSRRISLNTA